MKRNILFCQILFFIFISSCSLAVDNNVLFIDYPNPEINIETTKSTATISWRDISDVELKRFNDALEKELVNIYFELIEAKYLNQSINPGETGEVIPTQYFVPSVNPLVIDNLEPNTDYAIRLNAVNGFPDDFHGYFHSVSSFFLFKTKS